MWACLPPLSNGHYVVNSPDWSDGINPQVGASTWGMATAARSA